MDARLSWRRCWNGVPSNACIVVISKVRNSIQLNTGRSCAHRHCFAGTQYCHATLPNCFFLRVDIPPRNTHSIVVDISIVLFVTVLDIIVVDAVILVLNITPRDIIVCDGSLVVFVTIARDDFNFGTGIILAADSSTGMFFLASLSLSATSMLALA